MSELSELDLVNDIVSGDRTTLASKFDDLMQDRLASLIDIKQQEIASQYFDKE